MTLIIDMASGTRIDDPVLSPASEESSADIRLQAPATGPGLGIRSSTATTTSLAMPATLHSGDLETFLDAMD